MKKGGVKEWDRKGEKMNEKEEIGEFIEEMRGEV